MKIFLGGETAFKASEPFGKISRKIGDKLARFEKADPNDDTYGTEFRDIGIITTIIGEGLKDMWEERRLIRYKKREADIRLKIDYDRFINADEKTQELLYIKNIIDSIMAVEERKKGDFNGLKFIDDIQILFGITKEQINI